MLDINDVTQFSTHFFIVTRYITKAFVLSTQNHLPPQTLIPCRHLWTTLTRLRVKLYETNMYDKADCKSRQDG